jgi:hypothetical protein
MNIARLVMRAEWNSRVWTASSLVEGVVALLQPFRESILEGVQGAMVKSTDSVNRPNIADLCHI